MSQSAGGEKIGDDLDGRGGARKVGEAETCGFDSRLAESGEVGKKAEQTCV